MFLLVFACLFTSSLNCIWKLVFSLWTIQSSNLLTYEMKLKSGVFWNSESCSLSKEFRKEMIGTKLNLNSAGSILPFSEMGCHIQTRLFFLKRDVMKDELFLNASIKCCKVMPFFWVLLKEPSGFRSQLVFLKTVWTRTIIFSSFHLFFI